MRKIMLFLMILLTSFVAISCEQTAVEVKGIVISSTDDVRTVNVSGTLQLNVTVYPEGASQDVVWSSKDEEIATVSDSGLITGVSAGTTSIVATSKNNQNISSEFAIIVIATKVTPQSVKIRTQNGETGCKAGEQISLTAHVLPENANQSVEWSSSDETVAKVNRGLVTALKEGSVTITATSREDSTIKDSITFIIEPSDKPAVSAEWSQMPFSTHNDYVTCDDDTKLKVKGVVTYMTPVSDDGMVSYFIQSGNDGYYVYNQNNITYPVEVGKCYEVGGYKKYYKGLNEIVNVEHVVEIAGESFNTISLNDKNPTDKEAMLVYQGATVTGTAVLVSASVSTTKAFNVIAIVNGYEATLRIDPAFAGDEEFARLAAVLATAIPNTEFEFKGYMSAYGNYAAAVSPQIQIISTNDLSFEEASAEDVLNACMSQISVVSTIAMNTDTIELQNSITGFPEVAVSWKSDSELINVETGIVTHTSQNEIVKLTVSLTKDGTTISKDFDVTIFALDTTEYEVLVSLDLEDAAAEGNWGCSSTKPGYAAGNVCLGTPAKNWLLQNALIAFSDSDKVDGKLSIRTKVGADASSTGRIEILEAGEYNVVEFAGAAYGNHVLTTQVRIEYTFDDGATWLVSETIITLSSPTLETYRVVLPEGVKRVAIVLVENSGKTVNIDNIKLMK